MESTGMTQDNFPSQDPYPCHICRVPFCHVREMCKRQDRGVHVLKAVTATTSPGGLRNIFNYKTSRTERKMKAQMTVATEKER